MRKSNFKKRTWEELKLLNETSPNAIDYLKYGNRYKIILQSGDTTLFTNLFNPNKKKPHRASETNDVDYHDFEDNFKQDIDNFPPIITQEIKIDKSQLPLSDLDGKKLAVHTSYKPTVDNVTYVVWTSAGDDINTGIIGDGDILELELEPGKPEVHIDVKFNQSLNGRVWLHEGYLKFENGGKGDYIEGKIISEATPLQTVVNLDLTVSDNWIIPAPDGNGTHGFADPSKIVLISRSFTKDGDWDFDGTNLIPNLSSTGKYKISTTERIVHKYINKIPCRGTCSTYFSMSSDETAEIFENYFLQISAFNVSNTSWFSSVILEIYREKTYNP